MNKSIYYFQIAESTTLLRPFRLCIKNTTLYVMWRCWGLSCAS